MSAELEIRVETAECVLTNRELTSVPVNLDIKGKTAKVVIMHIAFYKASFIFLCFLN